MGALGTLWRAMQGRASIPNETRIEDYSVGNSGSYGSVMVKELLSIPAVWAAIREVSETIKGLPMEIQDAEGKPVETLLPAEDEVLRWFRKNIETEVIHLMVHGDGFQLIAMPNSIQAQLRILNPSYIRKVSLDDDGRKLYDTQQGILGEDEVLQVMGASYDGLRGMSPIVLFWQSWKFSLAVTKNAQVSFDRGHPISLLLQRGGGSGGIVDIEALRKQYVNAREGKSGTVAMPSVIEGVHTLPSNVDMQLLDALRQSPVLAAQIFRIPASRIGYMEDSTYNNRVQDAIRYADDTIDPIVERFQEAFNDRFYQDGERQLVIDTTKVYEQTFAEKAAVYQDLAGGRPLLDVEEAREGIGYEPNADLDQEPETPTDPIDAMIASAMLNGASGGNQNGA